MSELLQIKTFLQVARARSFSQAARQMQVVPSVVVKRITQLEKTVDAKLFVRTTRSMALTEAGEDLLHKSAGLVAELADVLTSVGRDEGQIKGTIRLLVPTTLNHMFLNQVLAQFMLRHPNVSLDVALMEKSVNPLEEGCDMVISGHSGSYPRVVDIALAAVNPVLCAAPVLFKTDKRPEHPSELATRPCLVYRPTDAHWRFESAKGPVTIDVLPRLVADDNYTLLQATLAGNGIAVLPRYVCQSALQSGQLEIVMPAFTPMQNWFKAHIPQRKYKLARVQALVQWLQTSFKQFDVPNASCKGDSK